MADPTPADNPKAEPLISHQLSTVPSLSPQRTDGSRAQRVKEWLIGDFNLLYFLLPISPFAKSPGTQRFLRFRRDADFVPLLLAAFLGLQQALFALGYLLSITAAFAPVFGQSDVQYAFQAATIVAGLGSVANSLQLKIPNTPYQIGSGLSSLLGSSHLLLSVALGRIQRIMIEEECSVGDAFGKFLGTAAVCALAFVGLALVPRKYVRAAFPPVVVAVIIVLIGLTELRTSTMAWGGGTDCYGQGTCQMNGEVSLVFGSPEYLGLGFLVVVVFLGFEILGSGFMRHNILLFTGMIVFAITAIVTDHGRDYVTGDEIDDADDATFLWTETYGLGFHASAMLPLLGAYFVIYFDATGILTAALAEAGIDPTSEEADARIQGGLITTGLVSLFSTLAMGLPVTPVPQTNSVTFVSRIASRYVGVAAGIWLFVLGVFPKVLAAIFLEIPIVVRGAGFVIASALVVVTGLKILLRVEWTRRMSIVVFSALAFGLSNLLVPGFVSEELWDYESDASLFVKTLRSMVLTLLGTPSFIGGVAAMILFFVLPKDFETDEPGTLPSA